MPLAVRALALWPNEAQAWDAVSLMRAAGLEPDAVQQRVCTTPGNQLCLCHRQWGKSSVFAAIALADACAEPNSLVLLISRSMRQSGELFRKVKQFYNVTRPLPLVKDTELGLELSNGSRILSLPGSEETIVGFSKVKRLILDEAARIPDGTYYAVRPMLAMSQGSLLAASTPFGQRGWFWEAWQGQQGTAQELDLATVEALLKDLDFPEHVYGDREPSEAVPSLGLVDDGRPFAWTRTRVTAPENPRITKRYLAHERQTIPDLWFRQEWLCEFVSIGDKVFRVEDLALLHQGQVQAWLPGVGEPLVTPAVTPWEGNGWTPNGHH